MILIETTHNTPRGFNYGSTTVQPLFNYLSLFNHCPYLCSMFTQDDLQQRWWNLESRLVERFGKKPDMEAVLFLIGIQETGFLKDKITKEQKQDLMHVAVCKLLTPSGYYELEGSDQEGWPHFRQLKPMPDMNAIEQENFLKDHILLYFESHDF